MSPGATSTGPAAGAVTDVPGVRVGHWTDERARTGCTVALLPEGTVASGEVRGGAPATRETDLLVPGRLVERLDAVVLTGGSAFGLAAADGVMRFCEERGSGFATAAGPVPIVVALGLYDLATGDGSVRPGPEAGYAACVAARAGAPDVGPVGAGTGATVGNWRGPDTVRPGGVGTASVRDGDLVVGALVAVNAFGDVLGPGEEPPAGWPGSAGGRPPAGGAFANTTIGLVVTNATLDKAACLLVAGGAHDGLARAIHPAHTSFDGDAVVAAAVGGVEAARDRVAALAAVAFATAVRVAVGRA